MPSMWHAPAPALTNPAEVEARYERAKTEGWPVVDWREKAEERLGLEESTEKALGR